MTRNLGGADTPPLAHVSGLIEWISWTCCRIHRYAVGNDDIQFFYYCKLKCHQDPVPALKKKRARAELIYLCQKGEFHIGHFAVEGVKRAACDGGSFRMCLP